MKFVCVHSWEHREIEVGQTKVHRHYDGSRFQRNEQKRPVYVVHTATTSCVTSKTRNELQTLPRPSKRSEENH